MHEPWLTLIGLRLVYERNTACERLLGNGPSCGRRVIAASRSGSTPVGSRSRSVTSARRSSRADAGPPGEARPAARARASTPTRSASRARRPSPRSASYPDLEPGHRDRRAGRRHRPRHARPATGGKLCFATLRDGTGDLQVMLSLDQLGEEALAAWKRDVDLGDHVGVEGEVITSRRGELSVLADRWAITAKCLRPLPDKHAGLTDPEARVRQRYVDLIVNAEARQMARTRSDRRAGDARLLARRGLPRGRDADAAADPRRRHRAAVHHPHQRLRHGRSTCGSRSSSTSSGWSSAASRRSSRSAATSATRAPTPRTTPSSRCSRRTRRTATTTRWRTLTQRDVSRARSWPRSGTSVVRARAASEFDLGRRSGRRSRCTTRSPRRVGEEVTAETPLEQVRKLADQHDDRTGTPEWGQGKIVLELYEQLVEHTLVQPTFVMRLPARDLPADPPAPGRPAAGREVGPDRRSAPSSAPPTPS